MQRTKNFFASFSLLIFAYLFYTKIPYFQNYFNVTHDLVCFDCVFTFTTFQVFDYFLEIYTTLLFLLYFFEKKPGIAKSVYFYRALGKMLKSPIRTFQKGLSSKNKLGFLTIVVKVFFAPLMLSWLAGHIANMLTNLTYVWNYRDLLTSDFLNIFQSHLFWLIFQIILFADVFFFTLGYLIELPLLKNKILSVDPTLSGWVVTLLCYPPFNSTIGNILPWVSTDFPYFENSYLFVGLNFLLLLLMGIYAWASVVLNFKASNLTHRGIVAKGPYAIVRHPAYICKNLAWWIGAIPALSMAYSTGLTEMFIVILTMSVWNLLYFLRAMTEERHLRMVNSDYAKYVKKVKYRFIPRII